MFFPLLYDFLFGGWDNPYKGDLQLRGAHVEHVPGVLVDEVGAVELGAIVAALAKSHASRG